MILARTFALSGLAFLPLVAVSKPGATGLLLALAAVAAFALYREGRLWDAFRQPWAWVLLALAAWGALSAAWAVEPADAIRLAPAIAVLFAAAAVWFFAAGRLDAEVRATVLRASGIGFAAGAAILVLDLATGHPIANAVRQFQEASTEPFLSDFLNPAVNVLVLAVWPLIGAWWDRPARSTLVILAAAAVLLLSASDAGALAFAAGALVFVAVRVGGRGVVLGITGAAALFVLLAPVAAGALNPERFAPALEASQPSGLHRLYVWRFTAEQIAARPATGWGLDSSREIPGGEAEVMVNKEAMPTHPHNAALQVWLELGPVGALLFAVLLIQVGRAIAVLDGDARAGAAAAFTAALGIAFLSFGIWQNWWLATLAVIAALVRALPEGERGAGAGLPPVEA